MQLMWFRYQLKQQQITVNYLDNNNLLISMLGSEHELAGSGTIFQRTGTL